MVVIFGWGAGEARDLGEVAPLVCPNCHNQVFLHQIHSQKKVSLYFVPIASYGSNEYLACPVCRAGLEIAPQHKTTVTGMRMSTRIFREGGMAPAEYQARVDGFCPSIGISPSGQPVAVAGPAAASNSAAAGGPAPSTPTMADRIGDLGKLHAQGILTDAEFAAAKRRILEE